MVALKGAGQPGQEWTGAIKNNLRDAKTVVVLASKVAMQSPFVMFEAGGALYGENKRRIPIVWDMAPIELPAWLVRYHALDLRTLPSAEAFGAHLKEMAIQINREKLVGFGIVAAILFALARLG